MGKSKTMFVFSPKQVRVLLKEVQEARGGPLGPDEADVSSSDISSSSHVISEHLVTFR